MKVSFDLDGVLFVNPEECEVEPALRFPLNRLFPDRLRKGTVQLIHELRSRKFEVWVYTSSFRTVTYIRALFRNYHVTLDEIINAQRHEVEVQVKHKQRLPDKMPGYYRIGLHVDDENHVMEQSHLYGFRALQIAGPDPDWAEKVLAEAERIRRLTEGKMQRKKGT